MGELSINDLPVGRSSGINAGGIWSELPDGRPNPQFFGIDWLEGVKGGTKIVSNPFASFTQPWFEYELKDKGGYLLLGGAALVLLLAIGGRRR